MALRWRPVNAAGDLWGWAWECDWKRDGIRDNHDTGQWMRAYVSRPGEPIRRLTIEPAGLGYRWRLNALGPMALFETPHDPADEIGEPVAQGVASTFEQAKADAMSWLKVRAVL